MFGLIKRVFIGLFTGLANASKHKKSVSLSNQKCRIQPTLNNLHPNEDNQEFHNFPFSVKLDRCVGSCNNLNDLSDKGCVPNKTEDLKLNVFNMIAGINASKTLKKIYRVNVNVNLMDKKCNSNQWWNNKRCRCECKKIHVCEKDYIWNPRKCICENRKY